MKCQPTMYGIIKILKEQKTDLSAKGIVHYGNYENTSENLQWIQQELFDLVEAGEAIATKVEGPNANWFFRLV